MQSYNRSGGGGPMELARVVDCVDGAYVGVRVPSCHPAQIQRLPFLHERLRRFPGSFVVNYVTGINYSSQSICKGRTQGSGMSAGKALHMEQVGKAAQPRLFYGWIIVAVAVWANGVSFGAGGSSFSVLLRPMSESLGWSRTLLTGAATAQSIASLFVAPLVGALVDRRGPRQIMVFGAIVAGACYLLMGHIQEPWQFYLLYTVGFALGLNEIGTLVTSIVVSKWFVRMRGRALAFTSMGNQVGAISLAPLTAVTVDTLGWRATWGLLGALIVAIVLPPILPFMRRMPEDMGLRPDGDAPVDQQAVLSAFPPGRLATGEERPWTVREALRTRSLWLVQLSTNLSSLAASTIAYHMVAYFADGGLSLQAAARVFALYHAGAMVSKIGWGFLAERIPVRYCLMANHLAGAGAFLILLLGSAPERVYLWAILIGVLGTAFAPLQAQIWADYYGRTFVGSIRGIVAPFNLFTNIGGPLFAALVYDKLGTYEPAFWVFTVALVLAAGVVSAAKPPVRR